MFYNNTPIVGWVRKIVSKSKQAAHLVHILALVLKVAKASPLLVISIKESKNDEVDYAL